MWKYYALLSALFAALTAIFAKIGVKAINSDLATAIRTTVILLITWGIVLFGNHAGEIKRDQSSFLDIPDTFRYCNRVVMALLFQGATGWRCFPCGTDRQT